MTDMVIDYSLEPFWVLDIHLRGQEPPPKSGRVPDFSQFFFTFLDVSQCFGGPGNFFVYLFWTIFGEGEI